MYYATATDAPAETKTSGLWTWIVAALAAALFTVLLLPTTAHADGRTVNLQAGDATLGASTVTLDEGDTLPAAMPSASKTGWTFVGWWSAEVTWEWWNDSRGLTQRLETPPAGYVNDPVDGHAYDFDRDYWRYIGKTAGHKLNAGDKVEGDTLYACFKPISYLIDFHWNGWGNTWGVYHVTRDYGTTTSPLSPTSWPGHTFLGWYDSQYPNQGTRYYGTETVTGPKDLYAHYENMAGDTGALRDSMIAARSIKISPESAVIKPGGDRLTLSATLTMLSFTDVPDAKDWSNVHWTVTSGSDLVSLSAITGQSVVATSLGDGSGTATVQASFTNEQSHVVTAKATITVKSHVHTYGKETLVVAPTCQKDGYGQKTCTVCGETLRVPHAKLDHAYKTETHEATCVADGYERTACTLCGAVASSKTLPATGHHFGATTTVASCTGTIETRQCVDCGFKDQKTNGGAGSHAWDDHYTQDKPATCGSAGSESIHCAKCPATKDSRVIPMTEKHVWGGWHTTKPATVEAKGEQERACTICGKTETKELPTLVATDASESPTDDPTADDPTTPDEPATPEEPAPEDPQVPSKPEPAPPAADAQPVTTYHLVNPYNGEHLYTTDVNEYQDNLGRGWRDNGDAQVPATSSQPVYRLYNEYSHEHHYTMDLNEYKTLQTLGWSGEGLKFYSDEAQGTPVYRFWKGVAGEGTHVYVEKSVDVSYYESIGWINEGIAWYYLAA